SAPAAGSANRRQGSPGPLTGPPYCLLLALLHRDLRLHIRPAAVITEITRGLARPIVDNGLDDVFARLAEIHHGRRLTFENHGFNRIELHRSRPAILGPENRHSDSLPISLWKPVVA